MRNAMISTTRQPTPDVFDDELQVCPVVAPMWALTEDVPAPIFTPHLAHLAAWILF